MPFAVMEKDGEKQVQGRKAGVWFWMSSRHGVFWFPRGDAEKSVEYHTLEPREGSMLQM